MRLHRHSRNEKTETEDKDQSATSPVADFFAEMSLRGMMPLDENSIFKYQIIGIKSDK